MNHKDLASTLANLVARHIDSSEGEYAQEQRGFPQFEAEARLLGFKVLGGGYFSVTLGHEAFPELAIKVGLKREDSGAAYAAYCRANQGRPGIPVIHEIARWSNCYTVVMDKLQSVEGELKRGDDTPKDLRTVHYLGVYDVIERAKSAQSAVDELAHHLSRFADTCEQADANYSAAYALFKTAEGIREFFDGIGSFDVHDGNVMMAGDQLVITDPVSFTQGIKGWDVIEHGLGDIEAQCLEHFKNRKLIKHNRRKNRPAYLKQKAKLYKAERKRQQRMDLMRSANRKEERHNGALMGEADKRYGWMLSTPEMRNKARKARDADHVALICGRQLLCDKLIDSMLMG